MISLIRSAGFSLPLGRHDSRPWLAHARCGPRLLCARPGRHGPACGPSLFPSLAHDARSGPASPPTGPTARYPRAPEQLSLCARGADSSPPPSQPTIPRPTPTTQGSGVRDPGTAGREWGDERGRIHFARAQGTQGGNGVEAKRAAWSPPLWTVGGKAVPPATEGGWGTGGPRAGGWGKKTRPCEQRAIAPETAGTGRAARGRETRAGAAGTARVTAAGGAFRSRSQASGSQPCGGTAASRGPGSQGQERTARSEAEILGITAQLVAPRPRGKTGSRAAG